jgi:MFS family permease
MYLKPFKQTKYSVVDLAVAISKEENEKALTPSYSLYGTGLTGMFSDSMARRYISLLAVAVGVSVSQMSWLRAGETLSRNLLQLFWGNVIDRHGKKRFIAIGRILRGILFAALIFIRVPIWLMLTVIGAAVCWSIIGPAWNSLLGDYSTFTTRGASIGKINALSQAGSVGAMVIALLISLNQIDETTPSSFTVILALAALMSIISGVLSLIVEEKPPILASRYLDYSGLLQDHRLMRYLLINVVYGMSMAFAWPLFPFIIVDKLNLKIWQVAAYSICSSASSMISQRYIGRLMDMIGRRPIIVFSRVFMAVAPVLYITATSWVHIALADVIMGVAMGAWMSSGPTYMMDLAPTELRATYLAANTAVFGVAAFFGNLAGGYVTENFLAVEGTLQGIHSGLLLSAILRFVTGLLYIKIYETYPSHKSTNKSE